MEIWRAVLVLAAFSGLFLIIAYTLRTSLDQGWRLAIIETFVVLGVLVWLITEALGAFRAITFAGLAISWGVATLFVIAISISLSKKPLRIRFSIQFGNFKRSVASLPGGMYAVLAFMVLSVLILGVIAFIAAPNNWDSMTYHLSRVMHWQQDRSLAFYPTVIQRQLAFGPLAEMGTLNFQILAGSDRLANFVQFTAMLGCVIGVSFIAKQLGGKPRTQVLAALAAMTLPMGILQATSPQNDYVVALWSVCFAVFALTHIQHGPSNVLAVLSGAALGLAILTKNTAIFYVAPFGLWFFVEAMRRLKNGAWKPTIIILSVAIIIVLPHALRDNDLYGNPLGITSGREMGKYTNDSYSLTILTSNILRNLSLELALPFDGFNRSMYTLIQHAHAIMGIDLNDRGTTLRGFKYEVVFTLHEDSASNPLHLLATSISAILLFRYRERRITIFAFCLAAAFLSFCFILKWQPWHTRLLLPLLVLAMPLAGVVFSNYLPGRNIYLAAFVLAVAALPYLVANTSRPLFGADSIFIKDRLEQYFYYPQAPDNFPYYQAAGELLSDVKCNRIGLVSGFDDREYLVWVIARAYLADARIEHILVNNGSARFSNEFIPCAIIVTTPFQKEEMNYEDQVYVKSVGTERFNLFLISDPTH